MIVNIDTGELLDILAFDDAVELTNSIRTAVADVEEKLVRAYFGRVWIALEYASWDDYVQGEFKQAPLQLPREDRRVQVASLRSQGLSQPAIAAVTGVSQPTIVNDLRHINSDKSPVSIVGLDGRERPATRTTPPQEAKDTTPPQDESCPYCGQSMPVQLRKEG